jgi:hypothetical protein
VARRASGKGGGPAADYVSTYDTIRPGPIALFKPSWVSNTIERPLALAGMIRVSTKETTINKISVAQNEKNENAVIVRRNRPLTLVPTIAPQQRHPNPGQPPGENPLHQQYDI